MVTPLTWLLDEKSDEAQLNDLRPAIESIGDKHITISRQEARYGTVERTLSLHASPTFAYGSIEFVKAVRPDFYPGKWCDWTELRCDRYFAKLGELLLSDDYVLLPAFEVIRRLDGILKDWGSVFLRPCRADKPFSGFVASRDTPNDLERRFEKMAAHDLVVVARVKPIEAEYRMVAVRGKGVVATSQYMQEGEFYSQSKVPAEALRIAEAVIQILGDDFPDPMYIVDIAKSQGAYRLLEINGFSYAVLYACDLEATVRAAHEEALREWRDAQN